MPHPIDILRRVHNLSPERIAKIKSVMQEAHMQRGDIIDGQKQIIANSYYIKKGAARVFYIRNGKEHTVSFAFDDEYLMTHSFLVKNINTTFTIMFLEDSDIVYVPHIRLHDMLNDIEEINQEETALFLNASLLHYTAYLEERIYAFQNANAVERYNWAVVRYPRLLECATVTQIASFLGLTKETLYRIRSGKY